MKKFLFAALVASFTRVAIADRPPPPPHRGPPPEAIKACVGLKADDACSFKMRDRDVTGKCEAPPNEPTKLACRPDGPPPRDGSGDPPPPPPDDGSGHGPPPKNDSGS